MGYPGGNDRYDLEHKSKAWARDTDSAVTSALIVMRVGYSHLFQNFPQFMVIHTVKDFGIVNKAEIDVFMKLSCFFNDPADVGNLISGSSAFSKTSLNIWKFSVHILLKPGLENFEHYLLACEMSAVVR